MSEMDVSIVGHGLPKTTDELLKVLDENHPTRCIQTGESLESAYRYAGARALIDQLIWVWAEQHES